MTNAEKMWHVWLNSPQGQKLAGYHSVETQASMKYAFIVGFEMALAHAPAVKPVPLKEREATDG